VTIVVSHLLPRCLPLDTSGTRSLSRFARARAEPRPAENSAPPVLMAAVGGGRRAAAAAVGCCDSYKPLPFP